MTKLLGNVVAFNQAKVLNFYGFNWATNYGYSADGNLIKIDENIEFVKYTKAPTFNQALAWINGLKGKLVILQDYSQQNWAIITKGDHYEHFYKRSLEEVFDHVLFNVFFDDIEEYLPSAVDGGRKRAVPHGAIEVLQAIADLTKPTFLRVDAHVDGNIIYNITEEQARAIMLLKKQGKIRRAAFCEWPCADIKDFYRVILLDKHGEVIEKFMSNFMSLNDSLALELL